MKELRRLDLDPVLSQISDGILKDEARHLAFNHVYSEEDFTDRYLASAEEGEARAAHLRQRLESVLEGVAPIFERLSKELDGAGFDREMMQTVLAQDARKRLETSISRGRKVAAGQAEAATAAAAAQLDEEPELAREA